MKKLSLIILFCITIAVLSADISLNIQLSDPDLYILKNSEYYRIDQQNAMSRSEIGNPALSWHSLAILLPPGHEATDIEVELIGKSSHYLNAEIFPSQAVSPLQKETSEFHKNEDLYQSDIWLPVNIEGKIINQSWFGYSIALTSFCTMQYNPQRNQLDSFKQANVIIKTRYREQQVFPQANFITQSRRDMVEDFVINDDMLDSYFVQNSRMVNTDLMIITPEEFSEDFTALIDYYQLFGWEIEIATTEYIAENLPGSDLQEQIRNHLINQFNENGLSYALLAGDVEHIPYRGLFCQVESSGIYEDTDIPADIYYSALDGNWDENNNMLYGEIGEADLLPEIAIARLPFSDHEELGNMINKTYFYSQLPVTQDLEKPLLLGELLWADPLTWGADFLDLLIGFHDDNGYNTTGIPENQDFIYLTDRDQGQWDVAEFIDMISDGVSFIHHSGHANSDYYMRMHLEDITQENFEELDGVTRNLTPIYTHGCICGAFDENDCIAEESLKLPVFTPAFVGNSRYGWFNEGQTEGPSLHIHREFVNSLYSDKENHIAMAHLLSKVRTAPWLTAPGQHEFGAIRWCFYDCNVLADPVLPVWTAQPQIITVNYPNQIDPEENDISLYIEYQNSGEPAIGARAALLQNGIFVGKGVADSMGICNIDIVEELDPAFPLNLHVNSYNVLPQVYVISINSSSYTEDVIPSPMRLTNYPNPFNPDTSISFYLENAQYTELNIYTIRGQLVKSILKENLSEGYHTYNWNGSDQEGNTVNSGVYIARVMTATERADIKMLLVK